MMIEEEINKRLALVKIDTDEVELYLEDCLRYLSSESLLKLYNAYDIGEPFARKANKKTKTAKINYLVREIPGQFIDYLQHMLSEEQEKLLIDLCEDKEIKLESGLMSFAYFGFIYVNKGGKIILPYEFKGIVLHVLSHRG